MAQLPTNIDASHPDDGTDPSVKLHQQYHDALHILNNAFDLLGPPGTPLDGSVTTAKVAAANRDGTAATASMRTLGTGAQQSLPGDHIAPASRLGVYRANWSILIPQFSRDGGNKTLTNGTAYAIPFLVGKDQTFAQWSVNIGTGAAATVIRLGVYQDDGDGAPGALLAEFGTVDASTAGTKVLAAIQALAAGLWWVTVVPQGGSPALRGPDNAAPPVGGESIGSVSSQAYKMAGTSGALPASFVVSAPSGVAPFVWTSRSA